MINQKSTAIVLIHGLWLTPRSWESFRTFYEERGFASAEDISPHIYVNRRVRDAFPKSRVREALKHGSVRGIGISHMVE